MRSDGAISNNALGGKQGAADEAAEDIFHALGRAASKL
jgi:hypothetical protein